MVAVVVMYGSSGVALQVFACMCGVHVCMPLLWETSECHVKWQSVSLIASAPPFGGLLNFCTGSTDESVEGGTILK